ncbi:MAG: guanylate kinase [Candidatus Abyssubacteria bacterium]
MKSQKVSEPEIRNELDAAVSALHARRGLLIVVSAPSGTGKTTVCERLLQMMPEVKRSVSLTTRPRRPDEKNGEHYYFVSKNAFLDERARGRLAEWAEVHGHLYGTPRDALEKRMRAGNDTVLVIDVHGAHSIRQAYHEAVLVFLLPPSWDELEKRLRKRGPAPANQIALRLRNAAAEFGCYPNYDYVVVNDNIDKAASTLQAILIAERHRVNRLKPKQ